MSTKTFPATHGGGDLLAIRRGRSGGTEIVYDDGVKRRYVWRVTAAAVSEARILEALRRAAGAFRILPALETELKRRSIAVERIA